jgi:hypothetical protein
VKDRRYPRSCKPPILLKEELEDLILKPLPKAGRPLGWGEPEDLPGAASNHKLSEEKLGMHINQLACRQPVLGISIIHFLKAEFITKKLIATT